MTLRTDTRFTTGSDALSNARTRLVGDRTGFLADSIVSVVRFIGLGQYSLSRFTRRASSVVTPLGWSVGISAPLAFAFGYGYGLVELIVAGYAMVVLVLIAVLYLIGRTSLDIELSLPHHRTVVGDPLDGNLVIVNKGRLRTLVMTVEIPVGNGLVEIVVPGIAAGGTSIHEFTIPAEHRGLVTVGPVRTVRADPIGLVRRELMWTAKSEVFVHPRTIGIPSMSTGFVRDLEGTPTKDLSTSDISFHALREYVPGDERRHIHWKSSAKTGTYMVRQFEQTKRSHLVIALSLSSSDYSTESEFELAVSVAGSLGTRAIRDTRDVAIVVSERTPEFARRKVYKVKSLSTLSRNRLLDELALVNHAHNALTMVDVARVTSEDVAGVSVAFLICGSATTATALRAASTKFPSGVEVVAVICDPESIPGLRRVAELSVLTIGYLEDLNRSLMRAAAS